MKSKLPIGIWTAPNPGLRCPACKSSNTSFPEDYEGYKYWHCFDCGELFKREEAYKPQPEQKVFYGEAPNGTWYRIGTRMVFTSNKIKEEMKQAREEREKRIASPEYQAWLKKWNSIVERKMAENRVTKYLETLTPEQLKELQNGFKKT